MEIKSIQKLLAMKPGLYIGVDEKGRRVAVSKNSSGFRLHVEAGRQRYKVLQFDPKGTLLSSSEKELRGDAV